MQLPISFRFGAIGSTVTREQTTDKLRISSKSTMVFQNKKDIKWEIGTNVLRSKKNPTIKPIDNFYLFTLFNSTLIESRMQHITELFLNIILAHNIRSQLSQSLKVDIIMGNSKSKLGVHVQTDKNIYLPGQVVQGNVFINAPQPFPISKILLIVRGFQKNWWKANAANQNANSNTSNQTLNNFNGVKPNNPKIIVTGDRTGQCKIIQAVFQLNNWGENQTLKGQYAFPFQFHLPQHIPGSFKQQKSNYKASISYQITAQCISSKKAFDNVAISQQLVIRQPKKPNQQSLFGQIYLYPTSCCCCKNGVSRICCYFQKNQYMPGQQCIAICEADNYKSNLSIRQINVKFKKVVSLTSGFGQEKSFHQQINEVSFPGVRAHNQYTGQQAKRIKIPLQYQNSAASMHPTTNGRLVKCEYFLQVNPKTSGCCVKNIKSFQVKLNILQQGHPQIKVEQPQDWNPQVYRKSQIIINEKFSNDFIDEMGHKNYF